MKTPRCEICGSPDADALCVRCGRVVCDRCFYGFEELCVECARSRIVIAPNVRGSSSSGISSAGLRMLGMLFIVFGLMITSMAFMPEDGEGVIVLFPFVIGNVSGTTAAILSLIFLGIFLATSLLPWYMFMRRRRHGAYNSYRWEVGPMESEVTEYMITIEIPKELKKTVYLEGLGGVIHLRSSLDVSFQRRYSLPEGFEMDDYTYEYDGDYLLLKLKLKRII
jgi:hypothetical protein